MKRLIQSREKQNVRCFSFFLLDSWLITSPFISGKLFWGGNLFVDEFFVESEEQNCGSCEGTEFCTRGFVSDTRAGYVGLAQAGMIIFL